jgi:hypothetical protein
MYDLRTEILNMKSAHYEAERRPLGICTFRMMQCGDVLATWGFTLDMADPLGLILEILLVIDVGDDAGCSKDNILYKFYQKFQNKCI